MLEEYEPEAVIAMMAKNSIQLSVTYEFYLCVFHKIFNYFFWLSMIKYLWKIL